MAPHDVASRNNLRFDLPQAGQLLRATQAQRRRWVQALALESVALAGVTAVAFSCVTSFLVLMTSQTTGAGAWLIGVGLVLGLTVGLMHGWRQTRKTSSLSRWAANQILTAADGTRAGAELLRSALEIAQAAESVPVAQMPLQLGSPLLVASTLRLAELQLPAIDTALGLVQRRIKRNSIGLALLLALAVGAVLLFPSAWRQLTRPRESTGPQVRDVGTLVADQKLRLEPPLYARKRLPTRDEDGGEGRVLRGGRVTVTAEALPGLTLTAVEFDVGHGRFEYGPVLETGPRRVRWSRAVLAATRYRYRGVDAEQNPLREQTFRELRVDEDQPPRAQILKPQGEIEVRAGEIISLEGEVSDDLGLQQVDLVVARPGNGVERRSIALQPEQTRWPVTETLAVDSLQLRPGDVALVHLEAVDNNPLEGQHKGESTKLRLRMFSADRYHLHNLDLLAELTELWTQRLGDRLDRDPAQKQTDLSVVLRARAEMAQQEQRALESLRAARTQLGDDRLGRGQSAADLMEIERQLSDVLADENRVAGRIDAAASGYPAVQAVYTLQNQHALVIAAQEQAAWALGQVASAEHEADLARQGKAVADTEKQLVSTLEKLADQGSAPLQTEAERLLDQLEQQMDRMATQANKQAHIVPYEHLNPGGIDALGLQRTMADQRGDLSEVRQLLRQGKAREALDRMRQIREAMDGQLDSVQTGVDRQRSSEDAALARLVQDLRHGVARAQQGQGQLRDELRPAAEEQEHNTAERLKNAKVSLLPAVLDVLQDAMAAVRPQRLQTKDLRSSRPLQAARTAMQSAAQALERGQYDVALQSLIESEDLLGATQRAVDEDPSDDGARELAADAARLAAAADKIAKASGRLREMLPSPAEVLRPATRARMEGDGVVEEQLRRALQTLRDKLAQADRHPALQRQVGDRLDHALEVMRQASESLRGADARRAFEQTAEILDSLERAQQLLDNREGPQKSGAQPGDAVGMGAPDQPVELRQDNQSDEAQRFREDVLRAMQNKAPPAYQERLQRYWKAIAR